MHSFYTPLRYLVLICFLSVAQVYGQSDTVTMPAPPPPPPQPIQYNAGFDVIIKTNGDIVYGLVTEVAPYLIFYKRTDIPDGPIYSIPRNEVYAISYRNQVKDYIQPFADNGALQTPYNRDLKRYPNIDYNKNDFFKNGNVIIGLGFLRSFSKVKNANDYSSSGISPVLSLGYEVYFKNNVKLGALIGFGSHKFSNQQYSDYDSTLNDISLKENIFGLYVYGKYFFLSSSSRLQPYITAGLGIATSHVTSENRISFTDDNSKVILVKSGARSAGINIMARIGAEYYISKQLQAFVDAGSGLSIINLGVSVSVK